MRSAWVFLFGITAIFCCNTASAQQCVSTTSGGLGLKRDQVCGGRFVQLPAGLDDISRNTINTAKAACQAQIREFGSSKLDDCIALFNRTYKKVPVPELFLILAKELHGRAAYQKSFSAYSRYCRSLADKGRSAACCNKAGLTELKGWLQSKQYYKVFLSVEPAGAGVYAIKAGKKRERRIRPRLAGYYCVHPDTSLLRIRHEGYITSNIPLRNNWGSPIQKGKIALKLPAVEVVFSSNVPNTKIIDPDTNKVIAQTPAARDGTVKVRVSPRGSTSICTLWADADGYTRAKILVDTAVEGELRKQISLKPPPSAVLDVSARGPGTTFYLRSKVQKASAKETRRIVVGKQRYTLVAKKEGLRPVEIELGEEATSGAPYAVTIDLISGQGSGSIGLFLDLFVGLNLRDYGDDRLATTPGTEFGARVGYFVKQWEKWGLHVDVATVFSPVRDQSMEEEEDWYHLLSVLGGAGMRYRTSGNFWLDLRLSLGALLITSIDQQKGSLFDGSSSENPTSVAMFSIRPELAVGFRVWKALTMGMTVAFEMSPSSADLSEEIGLISRLSFGGNVGWQF